jgi:thiopurine S-methyltransferase
VFGESPKRILVPLCGKSVDLDWLVGQGHTVVGVEFVPEAVSQLAMRLGAPQKTNTCHDFEYWHWGETLTVLQGNVFALSSAKLAPFDGIWDRAALVALQPDTRGRYAKVLTDHLKEDGVILSRALAYDPSAMMGPPFSVSSEELKALYPDARATLLAIDDSPPDARFQARGLTWQRVETTALRFGEGLT